MAILLSFIVHFVFTAPATTTQDCPLNSSATSLSEDCATTSKTGAEEVRTVANVVSTLVGLYGVVGWIPFIIVLSRSKKT